MRQSFNVFVNNVQDDKISCPTGELTIYWGNTNKFIQKIEEFRQALSLFEKKRSERFVFEADRSTYIISHFLLRKYLSEKLNQTLADIDIVFSDFKKPHIPKGLDFNLSHSKDYFAFTIADNKDYIVGVDLEKTLDISFRKDFTTKYMHIDEETYINKEGLSSIECLIRFFQIWTRKEAFLKMIGLGVVEDLKAVNMNLGTRELNLELENEMDLQVKDAFVYTSILNEVIISVSSSIKLEPLFIEL